MEYYRPQRIEIKQPIVDFFSPYPIYDSKTNEIKDILISNVLISCSWNDIENKFDLPIDVRNLDKQRAYDYNGFTYGIGKMIRLAELINRKTENIIKKYIYFNEFNDVIQRNSICRKLDSIKSMDISMMTFENLRSILSCILKTDNVFHKIKNLETKEERKEFTTLFSNYIEDRNGYTHGTLYLIYPSYAPIIRIKEKTEEYYLKYDKDVFTSNLKVFLFLFDTLSLIEKAIEE